jgi:hypothetical protein
VSGEESAARMSKTKKHKLLKTRQKKEERKREKMRGRKSRRLERTASSEGLGQCELIYKIVLGNV